MIYLTVISPHAYKKSTENNKISAFQSYQTNILEQGVINVKEENKNKMSSIGKVKYCRDKNTTITLIDPHKMLVFHKPIPCL